MRVFYSLIYCNFQVAAVARDPFGRLLAAGLAAYLAMHVLVNIAMMCALLPISGVPLIFVTYGGSSLLTTMAALGLLQSELKCGTECGSCVPELKRRIAVLGVA